LSHYNTSLAALLDVAIQSGRLDLTQGLRIREGESLVTIPIEYHGFAWSAVNFQALHPPPIAYEPLLQRRYMCGGIGVPQVAVRPRVDQNPVEARFYPEKLAVSVTALLRFSADGTAVLEFHNPLARPRLQLADVSVPITMDLSANLAWMIKQTPRTYFAGFIQPNQSRTRPKLTFLEPYQRGKIPIVLIHGLYSDPQTTADMINDLRAAPRFADEFQVWAYRYPSGQGILQSAATLRDELDAAVVAHDPDGTDPALRQMVLIGHSMGGLMAKLQVTHSEQWLWQQLANRPLHEVRTTEQTRAELARLTFFEPSPHVARVIFIATPHCGGLPSSELLGKCVEHLVETPPELAAVHAQLIRDNPGTFQPWFQRRFPTSLDMLAPKSPLLAAMRQMRIAGRVTLHNVIGVSHHFSLDGPSDGVVSVNSALHPGCQSVLAVDESHTKVHRRLETSLEVLRILNIARQPPP
jgi:pimeloyl-ACP methyl ester carboxylesterase